METDRTYEGWANYETWAIALQISNDYALYRAAVEFMEQHGEKESPYRSFLQHIGDMADSPVWPDSEVHTFTYGSAEADISELDDFMVGLVLPFT